MRREGLLRNLRTFLEARGINENVLEFVVKPQERDNLPAIKKRRSIVITGVEHGNVNNVLNFIENNGVQADEYEHYDSLDQLERSRLFSKNSHRMELNWRGRIIRFDQDFDLNLDQDGFDKLFLTSKWVLAATFLDDQYFGRHYIAPSFYRPPSSTPGFQNARYFVDNFVNYITRVKGTEHNPADPYYDLFGAFKAVGRDGQFQPIPLFGLNVNQDISIDDLFQRIDQNGKDHTIDQIVTSFETY